MRYFNKALKVDPYYANAHRSVGNIYFDRGQQGDEEFKYHHGGPDWFGVCITITRK